MERGISMIRAIIVEDERNIRQGLILTTDWASLDIEIIGDASNGKEGLELALKLHPDIILTDIKMPVMNGLDMLEAIIDHQDVVAVVLSGFSEFEYARRALQLGAIDYLVKPFSDEELLGALSNAAKQVKQMQVLKKEETVSQNDLLNTVTRYLSKSDRSSHKNIQKLFAYVQEQYSEEISVSSAAEYLQVSESYLSRLFRSETSYSFHEYLTVYRMKVACDLLMNTDYKIYEVANAVGFRDQRYFSSVFKKYFGMSPNHFKEQQ